MSNFNHGRSTYDFSKTKFSKVDLPIIPSQATPNMSGPDDADRNNLLRNYVSYIDYIKFGYLKQFGHPEYPTYVSSDENDGNGREITWASFVEILDVIVKDLYTRIYALEHNQDVPTITYTITYYSNGGNSTPSAQTVNAGQSIRLASAISKSADASYTYSFAGWNTNRYGTGTTYTAGQEITVNDNIDLYAKWDATPIVQPTSEYYWYVGTTVPTDPTNSEQNTGLNKWTSLGTSLPTSNIKIVKEDTTYADHTWYIAAPTAANFTLYNATNVASNEAAWNKSTFDVGSVSYTLWTSKGQSDQAVGYLHK